MFGRIDFVKVGKKERGFASAKLSKGASCLAREIGFRWVDIGVGIIYD